MTRKTTTGDRLARLRPVAGLLPTTPRPSETLTGVAEDLLAGSLDRAESRARGHLSRLNVPDGIESAVPSLSRNDTLRSQLARFAEAGIAFVMADEATTYAAPEARARLGVSAAVSRVFIEDERLLLETPRLTIRFEEGVPEAERLALLERSGLMPLQAAGKRTSIRCALVRGGAVETSLALLDDPAVIYAEPDFVEQIGHRMRPSDPDIGRQWHHGTIGCEAAWDVTAGAGARVAVIDNGFESSHADLVFGTGSGWFRTTPDYLDHAFVAGTDEMPPGDHGTACAGMVGASANNGVGGCGVAFDAELSMISCLTDQIGTQSSLADAIALAADPRLFDVDAEPAHVIACSLGPSATAVWRMQNVLQDAIEFAATDGRGGLGCPIFWACTNGNHPIGADEVCSHPDTVAVARTRQDDSDDGAGFGPELELVAPGVAVRVAVAGGGYGERTGTSFAAPCAAAVAALVVSVNPDLTAAEVRQVLRESSDRIGPLPYVDGHNVRFGYGRVNADKAVGRARALKAGF